MPCRGMPLLQLANDGEGKGDGPAGSGDGTETSIETRVELRPFGAEGLPETWRGKQSICIQAHTVATRGLPYWDVRTPFLLVAVFMFAIAPHKQCRMARPTHRTHARRLVAFAGLFWSWSQALFCPCSS